MKKILLGFVVLGILISGSIFAQGIASGVQNSSTYFPKSNPDFEKGPPLPRQMLTTHEYNMLVDVLTGVIRHISTGYWGFAWNTNPSRDPRTHLDINGALEVSGVRCASGDCCNVPGECTNDRRGTICFSAGAFYGCNDVQWVKLNL